MKYKVYWIHENNHSDPYTEGYVGVTNDLPRRLSHHRTQGQNPIVRNKIDKSEVSVLRDGLDCESALQIEHEYRPNPNIGWNINEGGSMPPSQKGRSYEKQTLVGCERTEKQKQASIEHSKRMKARAEEMRLSDRLPSHKGKRRSEESKQRYKRAAENRPVLVCPHCNKSGKGPVMRKWHFDKCKARV